MYLSQLSLVDFRSYAEAELTLGAGPTVFIGPNGQGKTNLVEAVGYLATQSSHRVAHDGPLVRVGGSRAVVRGTVMSDGRPTLVEIEITPGKANRARINRSPARAARDVLGVLRTVLFAPEDLALVKGDPGTRRRFLDDLLVVRAPRYGAVRSDYEKVLRQRNALLKSAGAAVGRGRGGRTADLPTLDVWDSHLARTGAELVAARLELVSALQPLVGKAYDAVAEAPSAAGTAAARLDYRSSLGPDTTPTSGVVPDRDRLAAALLEAMQGRRHEELDRGVSLVGPHRDDLELSLGPLPAKGYASQGESWSLALALRLASYELLRADGDDPVLVLDDVFAELDEGRRRRLADLVRSAEQVLVTAAVADDVPDALTGARVDVLGDELRRVR